MWKISSILVGLLATAVAFAQAGNTWTILFDDPNHSGTQTTTITISYEDSQGVKREKTISAEVSIVPSDGADAKKEKVQNKLNEELSKPENTVGGQPLASTGGTGHVMTMTPSPNTGSFSNAKIEDVETEDEDTGEKDKIIKPDGKKGLAQVSPPGEIIGLTRTGNPSVFSVDTNLGTATVQLTGSMTKLELLKAVRDQLLALDPDATIWIDSNAPALLILLEDDDGIYAVGAGTNDDGLTAVCKVMLAE